jgi:hypothetical protein
MERVFWVKEFLFVDNWGSTDRSGEEIDGITG